MAPGSEGEWRATPLRCHACVERARVARTFEGQVDGLFLPVARP